MQIPALNTTLFLLLAVPSLLTAQVQGSQLTHGQRVRIETCNPSCQWRHQGALLQWTVDSVTITEHDTTVSLPQSRVTAIDVEVRHGFEGTKALWGAVIGAAAFTAAAQASGVDVGDEPSLAIRWTAMGVGFGALFAGGGPNARRSAGLGLATGAGLGAAVGALACATSEDDEWFSCDPAAGAGFGALAGGVIGAMIGVVAGALDRDHWERISPDPVRIAPIVAQDGGLGFAASVSF